MNYRKRIILFLLFISIISFAYAETVIIMQLDPPSEIAPHAYADKDGKASGIMVELLEQIAEKQGIKVIYRILPRKRAEKALSGGSIDAYATSRTYLEKHENYIWTEVIDTSHDYLYSLREDAVVFRKTEDLFGRRIGTRLGYRYKFINSFFESGKIIRDDALREYQSLLKLLRKRVDAVIVNELIYNNLVETHSNLFKNKFIRSSKAVDSADLCIAFNRKWAEFVPFFNFELDVMKKNGEFQKIIDKYK